MGKVYRQQRIEGVTIPAVIHNGNYFYTNMAVYEDGTVSCWHKSDLEQFKMDLEKGWVVSNVPIGVCLSVHGLGSFRISNANWKYDKNSFYEHVNEVVRSLNPEMINIYHTTKREIEKWEKAHVRWSGSPTPCKLKEGFGYELLDGEESRIFYRKNNKVYLTTITAYADKTFCIDIENGKTFSAEEIEQLFDDKILCTALKDKEWVMIDGLGDILLEEVDDKIPEIEKKKEIINMSYRAAGEPDVFDQCWKAHYAYLCEPSPYTKEALRKAYEAVPEHERMFLGDMDSRDCDFIRILETDEKREV